MQHKSDKKLLYEIFYEFCFSRTKNEIKSKYFAEEMEVVFKSQTHHIVTISSNLNDGIGDYASQVYFTEKLINLLADYENVNLRNISYVSEEKQPLAKIVRENKINENSVFVLGKNNQDHSGKSSFIGVPNETETALLSGFVKDADFVFNLALGLTSYENQLGIMDHATNVARERFYNPVTEVKIPAKNNAFVASYVQYSFDSKEQPRLKDDFGNRYIDSRYSGPIYSEHEMGIHENQMGIRFDKTILKELEIQKNGFVFNNINSQEQSFAIGYLQNKAASQAFALMAVQTSPENKDMNILVNADHFLFNPNEKEQLHKKEFFEKTLKNLGITSIEIIKSDGDIQLFELSENPEKQRKLRLINFKGISDSDKAALYKCAEMIGASGDNSISEMITAGLKPNQTALPFPQQFVTSNGSCIQSILEEVKDFQEKTGYNHNELCQYLKHLVDSSYDEFYAKKDFHFDQAYGDIIKSNREKITQSWHEFCKFCFINRNNDTHFNELFTRYIFHSLLIHDDFEKFALLAESLGINAFQDETLLHLAVKANNRKAVEFILEKKLCDIDKPHSFNDYTALHLAASLDNKEILNLLIQHGANLDAKEKNQNSALDIAIEKSAVRAFFTLLEKMTYADRQQYLDRCLCYAVKYKNQEAIEILLMSGAKINNSSMINTYTTIHNITAKKQIKTSPLLLAIEQGDPIIVKFLLQNHANPDVCPDYTKIPIHSALNNPEILELLLNANADMSKRLSGSTLLGRACIMEPVNLQVIQLLLDHGADINQKTDYKDNMETPLHSAVHKGDLELIKFLLSRGADVTLKDEKKQTPLELYISLCKQYERYTDVLSKNFTKNKAEVIQALKNPTNNNDLDYKAKK